MKSVKNVDILDLEELNHLEDNDFRLMKFRNKSDNGDIQKYSYRYMFNSVRPMEFEIFIIENIAYISFIDVSKAKHRMNIQDIKRSIKTAKKCLQIKSLIQNKMKDFNLYQVRLENNVENFLISPTLIYTREMFRTMREFKRMTIG